MSKQMPKVVVMGGGSGIFPVIAALKHLETDITAIVGVSDSGGSSGRIRDEFGFQAIGDLRQSLAALAESNGEEWIRKILLYRFEKGEGLRGHNLGNLILTALQDMTGDTTKALEIAEKVFRIDGSVIPVTQEVVDLKICYEDGSHHIGEDILDQKPKAYKKIDHAELSPAASLNPLAREAIENADVIIIGPGDFYASLMAVLLPAGIPAAFKKTHAKIIYMVNLMTRLTQTKDMTAADHVRGIEAVIDRPVDVVVVNDQAIPKAVATIYELEEEYPVVDDLDTDKRVVRAPLISSKLAEQAAVDTVHRSLLRHDQTKLEVVLRDIVCP